MQQNKWAIAAVFCSIAAIFVVCVWSGAYGPIWRAGWTANPADWLGFAGNIVAGLMTIGAAGIAFGAVKMQIASDREIAARGPLQSMRAVKATLRPVLESLGAIWTIFDETLEFEGSDDDHLSRTTWLQTLANMTPPPGVIDDVRSLSPALERDRAPSLETVIFRLDNFYKRLTRYAEQKPRADELRWRLHDIRMMRLDLALLQHAVSQLEPAWTKFMGEHAAIPLDQSTYVDVIKGAHQQWLAEEAQRKAAVH